MSLREKQITTLERMLHLNKEGSADLTLASKTEEIIWKVLVLDVKSRSIVSSVLRVNDLLRCGITVHTLIDSRRSALPDVPAIYFIEPTISNVVHVIEDLDKYESFYINFTSSINRELLEEFAKKVSMLGNAHKIKQVFDQYVDFAVTEPELFSLDMPQIFTKFNKAGVDEDVIHKLADQIANGLLSTIVTSQTIPVIRAPKAGAAELVARLLDSKLRDYISNQRQISNSGPRPVLIILDRSIDLASMFSHSWIYQCMVSDVFQLERNTIKIQKRDGDAITNKSYDVDPRDFFWSKYSQLPFPDVVESADSELKLYKSDAHELTQRTGIKSLHDIDAQSDTLHIQQAVDALPELTARKATLDMHMDILAALISELQARSLDKFFEIEQNAHDPATQQDFLKLLSEPGDNTLDKLRTFLILILLVDTLPSDFTERIKETFITKFPEVDITALNYILKFKQHAKLTNLSSLNDTSTNTKVKSSDSTALFAGLSSKLYGLTEGTKISEGLSSIASRIKNLMPEKKQLPITNVVEALMDPQKASNTSVQLTDEYQYFDPESRGGHSRPPRRQVYQDATVFVIGGGNYLEYQNLQEWSRKGTEQQRRVAYGSTQILSAVEFLAECSELGSA